MIDDQFYSELVKGQTVLARTYDVRRFEVQVLATLVVIRAYFTDGSDAVASYLLLGDVFTAGHPSWTFSVKLHKQAQLLVDELNDALERGTPLVEVKSPLLVGI